MNRDYFRVLQVDLSSLKGKIHKFSVCNEYVGGSGLAAYLFSVFGSVKAPWDDQDQPLIFCIGPLTGYFPLMSKTVCAFKSPYHNQYTESHAGGRSALSLRFADLDGLVITGASKTPVILYVNSRGIQIEQADFLWGLDVFQTGKILRRMFSAGSGHRTIMRIGPGGENGSAFACINVDTYRHFGRLGAGSVMGVKGLKAILIHGDSDVSIENKKLYLKVYDRVFKRVLDSGMMEKYHDLGTPANFKRLNDLKSLPWRNLTSTSDDDVDKISGITLAEEHLLRNLACSGCPIGCIHLGYIRKRFMEDHRYFYKQVAYDYEPVFAVGSMLGITDPVAVLELIALVDDMGLDVISTGVALAWATEAFQRGIVNESHTLVPLSFGEGESYLKAAKALAYCETGFYRALSKGTLNAASIYGGEEFACVLGQEMAGYATGELFFTAQALGFRHSHLDTGAYSYEQKHDDKDIEKHIKFLLDDEAKRVFLNCMVACLFARNVYTKQWLAECLRAVGLDNVAENMDILTERIRRFRWQLRFDCGFDPESVKIPKRFFKVVSWKGPVDKEYLKKLKEAYAQHLKRLIGN